MIQRNIYFSQLTSYKRNISFLSSNFPSNTVSVWFPAHGQPCHPSVRMYSSSFVNPTSFSGTVAWYNYSYLRVPIDLYRQYTSLICTLTRLCRYRCASVGVRVCRVCCTCCKMCSSIFRPCDVSKLEKKMCDRYIVCAACQYITACVR